MNSPGPQHLLRTLEDQGISDPRVLDAMRQVPRDRFVPGHLRPQAWENEALPIGLNQTISQPYIVALMTQALQLTGDEIVLEVGTGSGYQAAVLARLCRQVVTIERHPELSERARFLLDALGFTNVEFRTGDGTLGCPDRAPFDGILVTAAAPDVPAPLYTQLAERGRLVLPIGDVGLQTLQRVTKRDGRPVFDDLCHCRFVPLIGDAAWPE